MAKSTFQELISNRIKHKGKCNISINFVRAVAVPDTVQGRTNFWFRLIGCQVTFRLACSEFLLLLSGFALALASNNSIKVYGKVVSFPGPAVATQPMLNLICESRCSSQYGRCLILLLASFPFHFIPLFLLKAA